MTKVLTPFELSRRVEETFSKPKKLNKIFLGSLKEDFVNTSRKLVIESNASPSMMTSKKIKETQKYSQMLSKILPDDEKSDPSFQRSLFNIHNIEKKSNYPSSSSSFSFGMSTDSNNGALMDNKHFFISSDFSECFDDHSQPPRMPSSSSSSSSSRKSRRNQTKLLDDEEEELSGMFDRLSTSESEG